MVIRNVSTVRDRAWLIRVNGALEATVEHNWEVVDLAELDRVWTKLRAIEAHRQWGKDLEPDVVSGTAKWNIYRVV